MPRKAKSALDTAGEPLKLPPRARRGAAPPTAHSPLPDAHKSSSATAAAAAAAAESLACPHCDKKFKQELGLQYHVSNFVCRPELKPPKVPSPQAKVATRKQQRVDLSDDESEKDIDDDDDNDSDQGPDVIESSLRRFSPRRKRTTATSYRDDDTSSSDDDDEIDDDSVEVASDADQQDATKVTSSTPDESKMAAMTPRKRKQAPVKRKAAAKKTMPRKSFVCPHCSKYFKIAAGYQYHIDNYVCRQELRPGGPVQRGKRKASPDDGGGAKGYKKVRGKLADRTCPKCQRVFTSTLGLKYHADKNVCESTAKRASAGSDVEPFPTLTAGLQFATKFGVVEVVADGRAIPTATFGADYKLECRKFNNARNQYERRLQNFQLANTIQHLAKRSALSKLHVAGNVTQQAVFQTSIRANHPSTFSKIGYPALIAAPTLRPDPAEPEDSLPDRIVECIVVVDKRQRFVGVSDNDPMEAQTTGLVGCKMYLQRRLLTIPYMEQQCLYCCTHCGQEFASKPGAKYHLQSEVCILRAKNAMEAYKKNMHSLDTQLEPDYSGVSNPVPWQFGKRPVISGQTSYNINMLPEQPPPKRIFRRKKEKSIAHVSVYPQVYLALGVKLLPRSGLPVKQSTLSAFRKEELSDLADEEEATEEQNEVEAMEDVTAEVVLSAARRPKAKKEKAKSEPSQKLSRIEAMNPRAVLADLLKQLRFEQSKQFGSVYDFAFKSLKFKKPKHKKKRTALQNCVSEGRGRRAVKKRRGSGPMLKTASGASPVADTAPAPSVPAAHAPHNHRMHAIDTCVLVDEVDSGRYPSMNRNNANVEHETECYLCKSDVEETLFQCQFCAHSVHWQCMRTRYIVKEPELDDFMCSECINYVHHRRKRAEKRRLEKLGQAEQAGNEADNSDLLTKLIPEREYDCLMAQGQRVGELTEILTDTRARLSQALETAKLDEQRYASIESAERDAQLVPMAWD